MNSAMLSNDAIRLNLLKRLEQNPNINQRQLAEELGISLGKVNYCIRAMIDVGWIKVSNFAQSKNKLAYVYTITPVGLAEKTIIALRFLKQKQQQYDQLRSEIDQLTTELEAGGVILARVPAQ